MIRRLPRYKPSSTDDDRPTFKRFALYLALFLLYVHFLRLIDFWIGYELVKSVHMTSNNYDISANGEHIMMFDGETGILSFIALDGTIMYESEFPSTILEEAVICTKSILILQPTEN